MESVVINDINNIIRTKIIVFSGTSINHQFNIDRVSIIIGRENNKRKKNEYFELAKIRFCIFFKSFSSSYFVICGFIYIFKGLLDYMPSDAELSGVLAHEITHVLKKHTVHQIEKKLLTTLAFAIGTKGDMGLTSITSKALSAGYSSTEERGADKVGLE